MTRDRVGALTVSCALGLAVLAGCGDDPSPNGGTAAAELQARVAEIRALAESRDAEAVAVELRDLRLTVEDLQGRGELDDERAAAIVSAAEAVDAQLGLITTTTTTTTTTTPPPPPRPKGEGKDKDDDKDKGDD